MNSQIELIAGYWTLSGGTGPASTSKICKFSLEDRIWAAVSAGYTGIGFGHVDLMHHLSTMRPGAFSAALRKENIKNLELEVLLDWFATDERKEASDVVRRQLLEVAAEAGARHIKVVGDRSRDAKWPQERLISLFHELCEQAARVGTRIALEIQPWSAVYNVDKALEIVAGANHPAGGVMLDIWHIVRENIPFTELAKFNKDQITAVELSDATAQLVGTLWEDTVDRRRLCGEGEFDIQGFIRQVQTIGYRGPYSVEIISEDHRKRSLQDQARSSFSTTIAQFRDVDVKDYQL